MQTPELKPCPFCGGEAYIADLRNGQFVTCKHEDSCRVRPDTWPISGASIEQQIEAWNKRAYVDADPVRHGRWVKENIREKSYLRLCTACGKIAYFCGTGCSYKYCPHCGAKMDGGAE